MRAAYSRSTIIEICAYSGVHKDWNRKKEIKAPVAMLSACFAFLGVWNVLLLVALASFQYIGVYSRQSTCSALTPNHISCSITW